MSNVKTISFPGLGIDGLTMDSVAISLFNGKVNLTWYSIIIFTGIFLAVLYVWFRFKETGLSGDDLLDFALIVVPSGIVGARLYFVIFKFEHYFMAGLGFWETIYKVIAMWEGGLAIYGGIIAGGIAAVLVARHKKIKILKILDMLAPAVMMAQSIGRWGNFVNGEAFGGPTTLPWRMCSQRIASNFYGLGLVDADGYYSIINNGEIGAHPTFFYESLWNIIGFIVIYFVFVRIKKYHKFDGQIFYMYMLWYGLGRFWIEGLRTDSLYLIENVIRISQLVALLSFLAGLGLLIFGYVRLYKYGKGEMILLIQRNKEDDKNGKNNKRKASSAGSKRKH